MSEAERALTKIRHGRTDCRLVEPYQLSFATIAGISSLWVRVDDNRGCTGVGEAVPLPGYADEEVDSIQAGFDMLFPLLEGHTVSLARLALASKVAEHPFAVSAISSAIDMLTWPQASLADAVIPLVLPLAAGGDAKSVVESMESGFAAGYRHFKMKTGRAVKEDIVCAKECAAVATRIGATLRYDANQGYNYEETKRFCLEMEGSESEGSLWLEQPLAKDDWRGMERLCGDVTFPLFLDEPIYNAGDVKRAASIGCVGVKLKLVKHPGMYAVLDLARLGRGLGLKVVLGNGVSTDIGNYCEALLIASEPDLFVAGAECNGYVKIAHNICYPDLREVDGSLVLRS
jgi:muconate cycloisomerase